MSRLLGKCEFWVEVSWTLVFTRFTPAFWIISSHVPVPPWCSLRLPCEPQPTGLEPRTKMIGYIPRVVDYLRAFLSPCGQRTWECNPWHWVEWSGTCRRWAPSSKTSSFKTEAICFFLQYRELTLTSKTTMLNNRKTWLQFWIEPNQ